MLMFDRLPVPALCLVVVVLMDVFVLMVIVRVTPTLVVGVILVVEVWKRLGCTET